ncbi:MAG TPA: HAMP domain-containing sensor histidine kinase [Saprospiraceae bacterium]|nr:HAMP domain-containing sensor histidine kinase [Saprospiraceae bacterium]HQU52151.1 HAMP domain-containing sensor histidine kinase [Saprospiraceae bacterium]
MRQKAIIWVFIMGAILVMGMLAFQSYWVAYSWSSESSKTRQSIYIALYNVAEKLAKFDQVTLPTRDLIKSVSSNYYVVNINNSIDANVLERFLIDELQAREINMDFEYAIYDCSSDEMVYGDFCSISKKDYQADLGNLPKYEEFTYYFGVKFPGLVGTIFTNMMPSLVFSGITVLALLFFISSVVLLLRQQKIAQLQSDFINNLTHEFKTPLSSMKIATESLIANPYVQADPKVNRYLHIIGQQNDRLQAHIDKILDLAKLEKESIALKLETVNLHDLLRETLPLFEAQIEQKKGKLTCALDAGNPVIQADNGHLQNVISNLLDNAIKYSGENLVIHINTHLEKNTLVLSIEDQGIGIPEEQMTKLFTKFYRVSTGNVHNVKGFGLGLYYVKLICDAHKWHILMESKPGKGTSVTIYFH